MKSVTRRSLVAGLSIATMAAACAQHVRAQPAPDRLILLGTMGGPVPSATRAMSSQVIVAGGAPYLFDCGPGAIGRLAAAGIQPKTLSAIFITHLHDDHVGELPALLMAAWASGLDHPVDICGPAPLSQMVAQFLAAFAPSIAQRLAEFPRPPPETLFRVHEVAEDGLVRRDANIAVEAVVVEHGEVRPAFGYRVATPRRVIAISGDTALAPSVLRLAHRADILVAEAMYMPALQRRLQAMPGGDRMQALLTHIHMTAAQAGQVAAEAGVSTLVLSHLIPGDDETITDAQWIADAATHFTGRIIVGRDLLEL